MQCSKCSLVLVIIGVMLSLTCANASTPDFIKTCHAQSQDCLRESLQASLQGFIKGNPGIGIEVMDPFAVNNLNLTLPGGLTIYFNNGVAKGFRKCVIDKARMIKDIMELHFHCNLTIKGKYRSSGRLLMFPIDGDGDSTIRCKNIKLVAFLKLGSRIENSQKYLEIKNMKIDHRFEGQVSYQLSNLFKGSPEISNMVLDFMNRNWKMVAEEFGKPIVDYGISSLLRNIKQLLRAVPLTDIISGPVNL